MGRSKWIPYTCKTAGLALVVLIFCATGLHGMDATLEDVTLTSMVNGIVRDTATYWDLRNTLATRESSSARATYNATYTGSGVHLGISAQTLILTGGTNLVQNEGTLRIRLGEPAFYNISGSNVWSGTTPADVGTFISLLKVNDDGSDGTIYSEQDTVLGISSGGFGLNGIAEGNPFFTYLNGTNTGLLFPGTYLIRYFFSISDLLQANADSRLDGWFDFALKSQRSVVTEPINEVIGYAISSTGGDQPWSATLLTGHDKNNSARSGAISKGQTSWMKTRLAGPGLLTFWWKVSSQTNLDFLELAVDGYPMKRISGITDWQEVTIPIPVIGISIPEVSWTYSKQSDSASGEDAAWVDSLVFTNTFLIQHFVARPEITESITSVDRLTSTGLQISPNANDAEQTKYYKVFGIQNGYVLKSPGPVAVNEGEFITVEEAKAGLRFLPSTGFSGTATFKIAATDESKAMLSPEALAKITVLQDRYPQSITFQFLHNVPFNTGFVQLNATASSGLPVQFTVLGPAFQVPGNKLQLTGVGEVTVIAQQPGSELFQPSANLAQVFTVTKGTQNIVFAPSTNAYVASIVSLNAFASSGLPVSYTLVSGPATLLGSSISFTAPGTVVVRASQQGNDLFESAPSVERTITVRKPQNIIFPVVIPRPFNAGQLALAAQASSGLPVTYTLISGKADLQNGFLYPSGAGPVVVLATQEGNDEFERTQTQGTITFAPGTQTLDIVPIPEFAFVGDQFPLKATSSSGLPVTIKVESGPGELEESTVRFTGNGQVMLTYRQLGNDDYEATGFIVQMVRVQIAPPKAQTITWTLPPGVTFDQGPLLLDAIASSGLPVTYQVLFGPANVSGNLLRFTGTGIVQVQASQAGNINYKPATAAVQVIEILKGHQQITITPLSVELLAGQNYTLSASASSGLPVTFTVVSGPAKVSAPNQLSVTGAGTIRLLARQEGNSNYDPAPDVSFSLGTSKTPQTIQFARLADRPWNDVPFLLSATSSAGLPVDFELLSGPATIAAHLLTGLSPGAVTVRASQVGTEVYLPAEATQTFTLTKADQVITFPAFSSLRFNEFPVELRAVASSGLLPEYKVIAGPSTLLSNRLIATGIGAITVIASQSGNTLYNPAEPIQRSIKILKGLQNISFTQSTTLNLGAPIKLEALATSGLELEFGVLSGPGILSSNLLTPLGLGEITIVAMQSGNETYEPATPVERVFTISKRNQSIQFELPATRLLGDGPLPLTGVASSGLPVKYLVLSGPGTLQTDELTPVAPGSVTIRAFQSGNDIYAAAPNVDRTIIFVQAPPSLGIAFDHSQLLVSWPSTFRNYHLESTAALSPDKWTPAEPPPDVESESLTVRVSALGSEGFFRLKKD